MTSLPRFKNSCATCKFVTQSDHKGVMVDVYLCTRHYQENDGDVRIVCVDNDGLNMSIDVLGGIYQAGDDPNNGEPNGWALALLGIVSATYNGLKALST